MQQAVPIVNKIGSPQLEFSEKYTAEHAEKYFNKHQQGFWRVLSNRRETAIARKLEARRGQQAYQNRFVVQHSQVESEFRQAGMGIIGHVDFLNVFSMWRVYVLSTTGN
jgi:hypothetical protein